MFTEEQILEKIDDLEMKLSEVVAECLEEVDIYLRDGYDISFMVDVLKPARLKCLDIIEEVDSWVELLKKYEV